MRQRGYSIKNLGSNEAEIFLYGQIGESWDGEGITAKQVKDDLQALGPVQRIRLRINSPGGAIFEALTLGNLLKSQNASVHVFIDGLAASSASVVAMCGDTIEASANTLIMIHDPWSVTAGTADDFEQEAEMLRKVKGTIITTYLHQLRKAGSKLSEQALASMMKAESWMSADEALGYGFIDSVSEPLQAAASWNLAKYRYRNAPARPAAKVNDDDLRLRLDVLRLRSECSRLGL